MRANHPEVYVAKPEWGVKRTCLNCGTRFYDMQHRPIVCPSCESAFEEDAFMRTRRGSRPAPAEVEPAPKTKAGPATAVDTTESEEEEEEFPEVEVEVEEEDEDLMEDASELGEDEDDMAEVIETVEDEDSES